MKNICIIGVGNIGSRHLQALKNVKIPLSVYVIDPSIDSLNLARERYETFPNLVNSRHKLDFHQEIDKLPKQIDVAIIATSSDVRRKVIEKLLSRSSVKFLILEKLLFQKKSDYFFIQKLLKIKNCQCFVNCSMRTMPSYCKLKTQIQNAPVNYFVTGSQYGLITNAIHYIDHMAFLTGNPDFIVNTDFLDPTPIESKRKGFLELNGTLTVNFKGGSFGCFSCFAKGDAQPLVEITTPNFRFISKESERKAYVSTAKNEQSSSSNKWVWQETSTEIPYQSQMTDKIVKDLLTKGNCQLVSYNESAKIHLTLLESLLKFLNKNSKKKYNFYPFT